jgi:hypothetical protein
MYTIVFSSSQSQTWRRYETLRLQLTNFRQTESVLITSSSQKIENNNKGKVKFSLCLTN